MPTNERKGLVSSYIKFAHRLVNINSLLETYNIKTKMSSICNTLGPIREIGTLTPELFSLWVKILKEYKSILRAHRSIQSELDEIRAIAFDNESINDIIAKTKTEQDVFSNDELLYIYDQISFDLYPGETKDGLFGLIGEDAIDQINDAFEELSDFDAELKRFHQMSNNISILKKLRRSLLAVDAYSHRQIILQSNILELSEDYNVAIEVINELEKVANGEKEINQKLLDNIIIAMPYFDAVVIAKQNLDELTSMIKDDDILRMVIESPNLASLFLQSEDEKKLLDKVQAQSFNDFIAKISSRLMLIKHATEEHFSNEEQFNELIKDSGTVDYFVDYILTNNQLSDYYEERLAEGGLHHTKTRSSDDDSFVLLKQLSELADLANELDSNNLEHYINLASSDEGSIKDADYLHEKIQTVNHTNIAYSEEANSIDNDGADSSDDSNQFDSDDQEHFNSFASSDEENIKNEDFLPEKSQTVALDEQIIPLPEIDNIVRPKLNDLEDNFESNHLDSSGDNMMHLSDLSDLSDENMELNSDHLKEFNSLASLDEGRIDNIEHPDKPIQTFSPAINNTYSNSRFFTPLDNRNLKRENTMFNQSSINAVDVSTILTAFLATAVIVGAVSLGLISAPFALMALLAVEVLAATTLLAINLCNNSEPSTPLAP